MATRVLLSWSSASTFRDCLAFRCDEDSVLSLSLGSAHDPMWRCPCSQPRLGPDAAMCDATTAVGPVFLECLLPGMTMKSAPYHAATVLETDLLQSLLPEMAIKSSHEQMMWTIIRQDHPVADQEPVICDPGPRLRADFPGLCLQHRVDVHAPRSASC